MEIRKEKKFKSKRDKKNLRENNRENIGKEVAIYVKKEFLER